MFFCLFSYKDADIPEDYLEDPEMNIKCFI